MFKFLLVTFFASSWWFLPRLGPNPFFPPRGLGPQFENIEHWVRNFVNYESNPDNSSGMAMAPHCKKLIYQTVHPNISVTDDSLLLSKTMTTSFAPCFRYPMSFIPQCPGLFAICGPKIEDEPCKAKLSQCLDYSKVAEPLNYPKQLQTHGAG